MDVVQTKPTQWPKVIGVIATVFGALGAVGGCFGGLMMMLMPAMHEALKEVVPAGQPTGLEGLQELGPQMVVLSGVAVVIAGLLLIGGIGLMRRRAWAVPVCITWAVVKILFVVVNSYNGMIIQTRQLEMMEQDPNMPLTGDIAGILGVMSMIFGLLWGWALPIFLLIWLGRKTSRAEVARWKHPDAGLAVGDPRDPVGPYQS